MFNFVPEMELSEKQIRILETAERLFAENGFDGASLRQIAKEAKINVAMVSYYFGSKEKMLEALVYYRSSGLKLQLEELIKESISAIEKVDKIIALYIKRIDPNKRIYQILHFEFNNNNRKLDLSEFIEVKKKNKEVFSSIIKSGQAEGIFRKDINLDLLIPTILGTYFQFQMNREFYAAQIGLSTEKEIDDYVLKELTKHVQQTIKALLTYGLD